MNTLSRTRLAVLGTVADTHRLSVVYDLACLRKLVADISPDLLCAEVTPEIWESGNIPPGEIEVREALAPLVAATDTVLIPVSPTHWRYTDFGEKVGWRRNLVQGLDRFLSWGQRRANDPEAINGWLFNGFCHTVCALTEILWSAKERESWEAQTETMAENILQAVRRDPGLRVLVTVRCQRVHRLVPLLKSCSEDVLIVPYQNL